MGTPDDAQVSTCVALCRFCLSAGVQHYRNIAWDGLCCYAVDWMHCVRWSSVCLCVHGCVCVVYVVSN